MTIRLTLGLGLRFIPWRLYVHYTDSLLKLPKKKAKDSLPLCLLKSLKGVLQHPRCLVSDDRTGDTGFEPVTLKLWC